jgi:MYXO-CTERM domain-containing protein
MRLVVGLLVLGFAGGSAAQDVPLRYWTGPGFPDGLALGPTNGVSWGDYDRDGWVDLFVFNDSALWRNEGGRSWTRYSLASVLIDEGFVSRYGGSFGDFNDDGFPDLVTEPRTGCSSILENLGGAVPPSFRNIATDPTRVDVRACGLFAETACWADFDGDADLDLLVPAYPFDGQRNRFYVNEGPRASDGLVTFREDAIAAGLANTEATARPEGSQIVDIDSDGDLDLYSNGVLYQNRSTRGVPRLVALSEAASGIRFSTVLDEGAAFADFDLDGDYDLFIVYSSIEQCTQAWENQGDGTFTLLERDAIPSPCTGLDLGLSTADWDNDGDVDFTTRDVFRRNMLMETGRAEFRVATTGIDPTHLYSPTPGWADWDRDGDLDCALGNWFDTGHFHENTLYDAATPRDERRYVRVRPLRDSATVAAGLETEYGASVELVVHDDVHRRRFFTASSAGYLNQNEYTLHFALPPDPAPGDPADVSADVVADFPNLPSAGFHRVDRFINPALGSIAPTTLEEREITIFRNGDVRIDGTLHRPDPNESAVLTSAAGGLALTSNETPLAAPSMAEGGSEWVGIDFESTGEFPIRMREIVLDGTLGVTARCGDSEGNVFLWDLTDPDAPILERVAEGPENARNDRVSLYADAVLPPGRRYRLLARVARLRKTDVALPSIETHVTVLGGVRAGGGAVDPCDGVSVARPTPDTTGIYASFRYGAIGAHPCAECLPTERCDVDRCVPIELDAGVDAGLDAGAPDGGSDASTIDSGARTDAGESRGDDGGCGCATAELPTGLPIGLALAGMLARRRRR